MEVVVVVAVVFEEVWRYKVSQCSSRGNSGNIIQSWGRRC